MVVNGNDCRAADLFPVLEYIYSAESIINSQLTGRIIPPTNYLSRVPLRS